MVVYPTENAGELRHDWNKLFDDVQASYQSLSPSVVEGASREAKSDSQRPEKAVGIRPNSPVLNLLLDAISLKFAELEKQGGSRKTGALHTARTSPRKTENPQEGCNDDSTDDEFFGSPSVMSYNRLRILDRPASSPMKLIPVTSTSSLPNVTWKKNEDGNVLDLPKKLFVSPKKIDMKMKVKASSDPLPRDDGFLKFVNGLKNPHRSIARHKREPVTIIENKSTKNNDKDNGNDFDDESTITLDATPPSKKHLPRPIKVEKSKEDSMDDTLVSLDATLPYVPKSSSGGSGNPNSFVITSKTKKQVWVNPDAVSKSSSSQGKKRFKQTSILSCARNMPQKKTDMSSLTTYNKGNRSSSQCELTSILGNKEPSPPTGTKRKSDESIESDGKRDKSRSELLSQTFFDVSPIKQDRENTHTPLTPPPIQKKLDETKNKPRSPLSPGKLNIMEEKPVAIRSNLHDSTYNLFKDFDKVPTFKPPSSKAEQSRNQANKTERSNKQEDGPVCCCPPPESELDVLKDLVDPREFEKVCPVHNANALAKLIAEANSPKDYWCTPQYQTQELYERGHIRVASTPFTPPPRRRRRDSNDDTILFNEENCGEF